MGFIMTTLSGWSVGSLFAKHNRREGEFVEGGRYYIGALYQWAQLTNVLLVVSRVADKALHHNLSIPLKIVRNVLPVVTIPICLIVAASKSGNYPPFAEKWNRYMPVALPLTLSGRVQTICSFFADHGGNVMRGTILVGIIGLHTLGDKLFANAALAALVYEALDHRHYIRQDISTFVDKYMTFVNLIVGSYSDIAINCIVNAVSLPFHLFSRTNEIFQATIGRLLNSQVTISGHTLEVLAAPPQRDRRQMSYAEIIELLDAPLRSDDEIVQRFEIDPAHCSRWDVNLNNLSTEDNPDRLLEMWAAYSNEEKMTHSLNRIFEDERQCRALLNSCYPDLVFTYIPTNIDLANTIRQLMLDHDDKLAIEQYALNFANRNLHELVSALKGEGRLAGSSEDLSTARRNLSYLIPHFNGRSEISRRDFLLRLTMPLSGFSSLGVNEEVQNLYQEFLIHAAIAIESGLDVNRSINLDNIPYEPRLKKALLDLRLDIIHRRSSVNSGGVRRTERLSAHHRQQALSRGLLPGTPSMNMMVEEFFEGATHEPVRLEMQREYLLNVCRGSYVRGETTTRIFQEWGFVQYLQQLLNGNTQLTPEQCTEIRMRYANDYNNNNLVLKENLQRLVLLMLGVIRKRPLQA